MPETKNILVAVDFSAHTRPALAQAFYLAEKLDARVHLLHVFTLQNVAESTLASSSGLQDVRESEQHQLNAAAEPWQASGRLGSVLWHEGDPATQIVRTADELAADLIVIGASGRGALTRLVLGSVAESVTRSANCDVLIVRRSS